MGVFGARPWLNTEVAQLEQLVGESIPYAEISTRVGHTLMSCRVKMAEIRRARGNLLTVKFSAEHLQHLEARYDASRVSGHRVDYAAIAAEIGHPQASCKTMMSRIQQRRLNERNRAVREEIRAHADGIELKRKETEAKDKTAPPAGTRSRPDYAGHIALTPRSKLIFDQELRDRIRERGLTAGFFGDPMPGRSALDRKRSEAAP